MEMLQWHNGPIGGRLGSKEGKDVEEEREPPRADGSRSQTKSRAEESQSRRSWVAEPKTNNVRAANYNTKGWTPKDASVVSKQFDVWTPKDASVVSNFEYPSNLMC